MKIRFWLYLFFAAASMLPLMFVGTWLHSASALAETGLSSQSMAILVGFTLAAAALVSILLSHLISRPMERMHAAFQSAETGGNIDPVPEGGFSLTLEQRELEASFNHMVMSLRQTRDQMARMAYHDDVTGLPNRDAMRKLAEPALAALARKGLEAAVLFIDIDNFKEINDLRGHQTGDQVLRYLAARLADIVETATGQSPVRLPFLEASRGDEVLPRVCIASFNGDGFVLFLPANCGFSQRDTIARQINEAITAPIPGTDIRTALGCSIGIALFPEHGLTCEDLIKRADIAMHHAKKHNRGSVTYFGAETGDISASELRRLVQQAIANSEMTLYYQPKVCSLTNQVESVEALVRWVHPEKGVMSPGYFIPAIENSDTTRELGEWVIRRACRDMKAWDRMGINLSIAVNIAARQFISPDFTDRLSQIVDHEGCDPSRFEIEVTEETALSNHDQPSETVSRLHECGFKVSLDDYGRGYSNLTRLSELRVDTLKIDGPLTARLTRDQRTRVIFEATINMAHGLGCKTVAEGVETAEEAAILRKLGCSELQGFYFSTPLPFEAFNDWLESRAARKPTMVA